jgi:hypothetical protein
MTIVDMIALIFVLGAVSLGPEIISTLVLCANGFLSLGQMLPPLWKDRI